jgi:hypothetical protein
LNLESARRQKASAEIRTCPLWLSYCFGVGVSERVAAAS